MYKVTNLDINTILPHYNTIINQNAEICNIHFDLLFG